MKPIQLHLIVESTRCEREFVYLRNCSTFAPTSAKMSARTLRRGISSVVKQGEVAEWSIAAVLKTVDLHGSGGSNPSLSALTTLAAPPESTTNKV